MDEEFNPAHKYENVRMELDGTVASIIFSRTHALNALDRATATEFLLCCQEAARNRSIRALVLKAEGRAFGVGGDLASLRLDSVKAAAALIQPMHDAVRLLSSMDAPVIASLHGYVAGGSLSLALACDLAVAADNTCFNLAYTNVGASGDVGSSWNLPRLVGLRNALEIALLSENFDAATALRLGMINRIVPAANLGHETMALAKRLASGPTLAFGRMKRLMRDSFSHDFASHLDAESVNFCESVATADFQEAVDAFFAKRAPVFQGR